MKTNITGIIDNVSGATISASPETLSMGSIGGSVDLSINCNIGWKIVDLPDFVSVSDVRGHGNKTVRITFAENRSTTSDRSGSFKVKSSRGEIITISVSQSKAVIDWVYTFNVSPTSLSFEKTGDSKSVAVTSYKTPYIHGTVSGSNVDVNYTSSSNNSWCTASTSSIIVEENPDTSTRTASVTYTQAESGKSSVVSVTQAASVWTWKYDISVDSISWTSPATPSSKDITVSAWRQKYLNGRATDTKVTVDYTITNNNRFVSAIKTTSGVSLSTTNNTTSSAKSGTLTFTPVLDDTTLYPLEGSNTSASFTVSQEAGVKIYSAVTASLSYPSSANAAGGTCSPSLTYSQTYTWNGVSGGGRNVASSDFTVGKYSMSTTTGASINTTSGVVTWENNQSSSARTSSSINVTVTGLGGNTKTVSATCSQNAGYYTYSNITFDTLTYGTVNSGGGTSSPSIKYTQTYGWNGATSGAGTITGGNNDDDYTTYSVPVTTGLSLNTSTGVATWDVNKGTSGSEDSTTRSATVTASVTRNGKTATKTATVSQTGEKEEGPSNISYGPWSFSISPSSTTIASKGGSVTISLTRPTRTVTKTYLSGDVVTYTETATAGTFAITRSNSSFTLSTTSVTMTSSSLPSFTLTGPATGAAVVDAISSTVTAAFTATNPTTGTTTASKTTDAITRQASALTNTAYRISSFTVGTSTFNAASNSTTLSIKVQRQQTFTDSQVGSWTDYTPSSGLTITCGTGASAGAITYGATSTCTISIAPNTGSARTISVSGSYSGGGSGSVTLSQSADEIISTSYSNVTAGSISNTTIPASGTTTNYTASAGNGSQVLTYTWRSGKANTSETKSISPSHASISATASSKGTSISSTTTVKSQAVTWSSLDGVTSKNVSGTMYIYQAANACSIVSVTSTPGSLTNTSFGAGKNTIGVSATAASASAKLLWTSGSEVTTNYNSTDYGSWTFHGYTASSNQTYATVGSVYYNSVSVTMASRETTESSTTRSAIITRSEAGFTFTLSSAYGGASKKSSGTSCTCTVTQAANTRSVTSIYIVPYQPDSSWITTVTNGNWNTVPASGGYLKAEGWYTYTYASGSTKDERQTYDAALTFSGSPSWITNHTNGGYYVAHRYSTTGDARSTTATWSSANKTSPGKTVTQAANNATYTISVSANPTTIAAKGGTSTITRSGSISYTSGSDGSFTPNLTVSGTGFSISGTTVTASNNTTTSARSGVVTASYNGATSKTVTISQSAGSKSYGSYTGTLTLGKSAVSAAADSFTVTYGQIYRPYTWNGVSGSGGNEYYSGTAAVTVSVNTGTSYCSLSSNTYTNSTSADTATLSKSTYGTNSVPAQTYTLSLRYGGTTGTVCKTATFTCGGNSYTDSGGGVTYGSWGGGAITFSSTGALSAGADSRTVYIAPWTRAKNTAAVIRTWTSTSTQTLSNASSTTDYYTGSVTVSENGAYTSLSATSYTASSSSKSLTLTKSTCGANSVSATTVTVTAVGATTTTGSLSQSANSKSYTTYSNLSTTIGDIGANGSATGNPTTTYAYNYAWTSGSTGADWFTVTGRGSTGSEYVTYSVSGTSNGATLSNTSGSVKANSRGTTTKSRTKVATLNMTFGGWGGGQGTTHSVAVYQAANAVTNSAYNAYNGSYWASCSIGTGITAAGGSATVTKSAGHTYYYQQLYTSGSVAPSSSTYYSSAQTDNCTIKIVSNGNGRFSLSGTTLSHSTMGASATTDTCTVRCTNSANTGATKDASVSVTNSKNAGTYSIASVGNVSFGYSTGGAPKYKSVSSYYTGTYTSGSSYSDWVDFSINSKPSWAQVGKYGGEELQITVDDNESVSSRSGTVTLLQSTSGKATSFTITQEGAPKTVYLIDVMPENDSNISIMFSEALSNPITLLLYVEDQRYWNTESIKVTLSPGSESYFVDVSDYSSLSRVDWVCVESIDYEGPEQIENYAQSC